MGSKRSREYAQEVMENIFHDREDTAVYIDDVEAFSYNWKDHLAILHLVCERLVENGFTVNPLKWEWGVKEADWVGYWLTPK